PKVGAGGAGASRETPRPLAKRRAPLSRRPFAGIRKVCQRPRLPGVRPHHHRTAKGMLFGTTSRAVPLLKKCCRRANSRPLVIRLPAIATLFMKQAPCNRWPPRRPSRSTCGSRRRGPLGRPTREGAPRGPIATEAACRPCAVF
ncbi:unnamed protein product, partial [Amoebophrya sp. A120]